MQVGAKQIKMVRIVKIVRIVRYMYVCMYVHKYIYTQIHTYTNTYIVRIVRIFRRLRAANRIITALLAGIVPVTNAFIILLIFTAIYAVLGTHIFHQRSPEFFGTFSTSLFSMMQVVNQKNDRQTPVVMH